MNKVIRTPFLLAVVLVCLLVVVSLVLWFEAGPGDSKVFFDGVFGAIVGGLITATVTFGLVYVALGQLDGVARTASADFILRRVDQFFRPETRRLVHLAEDGYLVFELKNPFRDSFFRVDDQKINSSFLHEEIKRSLLAKPAYATYEVDDLLLGPLEDLGSLEADESKLISFDEVYDFFGWYISRSWENEQIRKYVTGAREERKGGSDLYKRLEALAARCAEREASEK